MKLFSSLNIPLVRNFSSGAINRVIAILSQVILVPLFISTRGREYYGEWLILSTLPAYLSASDFGINVTVTNAICASVANNNRTEALKLYHGSNNAFIKLTIIGLFFYIISCIIFDWSTIMHTKISTEWEVESSLLFLITSVFCTFFLGSTLSVFRAEGRYDKYQNTLTILQVIDIINIIINLLLSGTIFSLSISSFILRLFFLWVTILKIKKTYKWFYFGFKNNLSSIIHLLPTSIYYMITTIAQGLILQGTTYIIGSKLGTIELVNFNTTRTLLNSIKSFVGVFYYSFLPNFTIAFAKNNYKEAKRTYLQMMVGSILLASSFAIVLYLFGNEIIKYWTVNKVGIDRIVLLILLLSSFFNTLWNASYSVLNSANCNREIGLSYLIMCIMTIISMLFTNKLTTFGYIILLNDLIMLILTFTFTNFLLNQRMKPSF